jgi:hypothetical protein
MENRIKEQQLALFADRTSCHYWWANQFRLLLSSLAYILLETIRRVALQGTELARAYITPEINQNRRRHLAQHTPHSFSARKSLPVPATVLSCCSQVNPWIELFCHSRLIFTAQNTMRGG